MKDKGSIQRGLQILGIEADASFFSSLLLPSIKIIAINIVSAVLLFVANYILIRNIGDSAYGHYVVINVWLSIFSVVCLSGMDDYFIATLPKFANTANAKGSYASVLLWSLKVFALVTCIVIIVLLILSGFGFLPEAVLNNRGLFFWLLPALTLLSLLVNFLRGSGDAVVGQVIDKLVRQGIFLISILIWITISALATLKDVLTFQVLSLLLCCFLLFLLVRKKTSKPVKEISLDRSGKTNLTFLFISLLYLLSTRLDLLFLESHVRPEKLGYYNIAARIADLAAYPVVAMNLVMPVLLSKTYHHQIEKLRTTVRTITGFALGVTLAALLFIILFGKSILAIFGEKFVHAFWPLIILCAAQLFAACAAPRNGILMVSGNQRKSLLALVVFVLADFLLCLLFIPLYGSIGAAVAILGGQMSYFVAVHFFSRKLFRPL